MKILYLNPHFTCCRVHATFPDLSWREIQPPYEECVELIAPDIVIRETEAHFSEFPFCCPTGGDYFSLMRGEKTKLVGRAISKEDVIIFISIAHLFHNLYEGCNEVFDRLSESGVTVRFWLEKFVWDFHDDRQNVSRQFEMMLNMNQFVNYKEEIACRKQDHYRMRQIE